MTRSRLRAPGGQLADAASARELRRRVHSGFHDRSERALTFASQHEALQQIIGGIGAPCWAWADTAAALHGFDDFILRPPFHLAIRRGRHVNRIGNVIHTVSGLERIDTATVAGIPVSSSTRTIIELARSNSNQQLTVALDSATRDGGTSDDFLHRRIVALRSRGRPGLGRLLGVIEGIEATRGGHSWLEREFLRIAEVGGLPRPTMQQVIGKRKGRLIRVDCYFPGTNVVVELLGYTFHRTLMQMQNDAERMNQLLLDGHEPYQFTYLDVVEGSESMLTTIRSALGRAA